MRVSRIRWLAVFCVCLLAVSGLVAQEEGGQVEIGAWSFSGDYTLAGTGTACADMLPAGGFALGFDQTTCAGVLNGGTAVVPIHLPISGKAQVVTLTFTCPDDDCTRHLGI